MSVSLGALDLVDELRLRRWARENYVPAASRDGNWHRVVLEEMQHKEEDLRRTSEAPHFSETSIPLRDAARLQNAPAEHFTRTPERNGTFLVLHQPHSEHTKTELLLKVPCASK